MWCLVGPPFGSWVPSLMNQTGTSKEKDQPQGSVESEGWSVTSGLDSPADINQETGDILKGCHGGRMAT